MNSLNVLLIAIAVLFAPELWANGAANLASIVQQVKPAVVGIGIHTPTGRPQDVLQGTGFVIGNGRHVVTNFHVLPKELDDNLLQQMAVFVGTGARASVRFAKVVASSAADDLAVLEIQGAKLPALALAKDDYLAEGNDIAFTGFPIGSVLGLYPVTHRGIISSITPIVVPVPDARQISIHMLKQMRDPYLVYQLDATAYPGNSGSALYDVTTGKVVGIINKVFVQSSKEAVIEKPSGITYAIPVKRLKMLLSENNIAY
jgi:serine protease Do